jgi:membrane protein
MTSGTRHVRLTRLKSRHWWDALKGTVRRFGSLHLTDWAAALTYYAVLAVFPAFIVLVATLGLVGQHPETTNAVLNIVGRVSPPSTVETLEEPVAGVIRSKGGAGALLGIGLIGALWSASAYIGAFVRASNTIYEIQEGRPFWRLRPLQLLLTLAAVLLVSLLAVAIVLTGDLAEAIGDEIGLQHEAVTAWGIFKWPLSFAIVTVLFDALYYLAPNVRQRGFRWITPGGVVGVLLWVAASAGFALYVANFDAYNKTYGTIGAVIVFLVWLWITNIALLLGAVFNAEIERGAEIEEGVPRPDTLAMTPREPAGG